MTEEEHADKQTTVITNRGNEMECEFCQEEKDDVKKVPLSIKISGEVKLSESRNLCESCKKMLLRFVYSMINNPRNKNE